MVLTLDWIGTLRNIQFCCKEMSIALCQNSLTINFSFHAGMDGYDYYAKVYLKGLQTPIKTCPWCESGIKVRNVKRVNND